MTGEMQPGAPPDRGGRRGLPSAVRKILLGLVAFVLACVLGFGILLLVTPSVGNARQLAQGIDKAHAAPYPGIEVPARFAAALEATEDHRFASEPGIDPVAVGRVALGAVAGKNEGGATLYQQLAKMLYTPGQSGLTAEAEQVALAVKLKYSYSGAEILRLYADVAYFGHGFYGLLDASCGYFGVQPAELSWPQAALLAGLVQGPTTDDPIDHPAAGLAREQHVMGRLVAVGKISQASADAYLKVPLSQLLAHAGACRG
jgi:membrane peptidoglycan carboxypeptidase